jgi:arylsulfatase A-like enzyme
VLRNEDGHKFDDSNTVATWLHDSGYYTGLIGKYLNRYPFARPPFTPPGWDDFISREHGDETTVYFNYTLYENGTSTYYGVQPNDYMPDVLTTKAVDFIQTAPSGRPFFLYFAPTAPHAPWLPAPRHEEAYNAQPVPHPPDFNEADVSDKPGWVQRLPSIPEDKQALLDYQHRHEDDTLLAVDDSVHAIMNALQARGALDNTVILYLTDNGYSFGEHRWVGKRCAYDECTRTPFYVRYPDAVMHTDNTVISNADIAPTLAAFAGTSPQLPEDGRSLVSLIDPAAHQQVFRRLGVVLEWAGDLDIPQYWALRTKRWLYVEYPASGERELYDMAGSVGPADPYQLHNLAGDPSVRTQQEDLADQLHRLVGQQALQSPVAAGSE